MAAILILSKTRIKAFKCSMPSFSPWHLDKEFARIVIESSDVDVESIILLHSNEYVYKSALANN